MTWSPWGTSWESRAGLSPSEELRVFKKDEGTKLGNVNGEPGNA